MHWKQDNSLKELKYDFPKEFKQIRKYTSGISQKDHDAMIKLYGPCCMELTIDPWYVILIRDTVNVYYLYQTFGLTVWYITGYYKYATLILVFMMYSLFTEFLDLYDSFDRLKKMAGYHWNVMVRRVASHSSQNGIEIEDKRISSKELVPGDLFHIPDGCILPWDAIMIKGETVVNEAMLTGESVPSIKTTVPNNNDKIGEFSVENGQQVSLCIFTKFRWNTFCFQAQRSFKINLQMEIALPWWWELDFYLLKANLSEVSCTPLQTDLNLTKKSGYF